MKGVDLNDLWVQMKITNRLLAAQLRSSMGQKDLVGVLMSTGATYGDIADVLDTSAATVEVTARRIRNDRKGKRNRRRGGRGLGKPNG
jgi:DNA-directed RNA polymerase specialized sigma24 family protein